MAKKLYCLLFFAAFAGLRAGFSQVPTIASFSPANGPVGTSVTITGTNFNPTPSNNTVKFAGTSSVVTASTSASITTSVPAGAPPIGPITVTTSAGTTTGEAEIASNIVANGSTGWSGAWQKIITTNKGALTSVTLKLSNFQSINDYSLYLELHQTDNNPGSANPTIKFNSLLETSSAVIILRNTSTATEISFPFLGVNELAASTSYYIVLKETLGNPAGTGQQSINFNPPATNGGAGLNFGTLYYKFYMSPVFKVTPVLPAKPTTQASNLIITQPFASTINVTWTNGNGSSRIVVAKQGGAVDQAPIDGVTYAASSSFTSGDDLSGGNYVVYNGTGNSISVTDIQTSTSYQFFVFEYNGSPGSENYNISTATNNPKSNSATSVPDISIPYSSFGSAESNYRIIAVPLNLTNNKVSDVFDELMPYDDTKWRMFHYQNGSNQEMNGNSTISPGKGYWLIVKDSKTFTSGPGTTVLAPFSVPLVQGWNQIGNPYNFNISWADVQAANPGLPGLRKWINTMTDGTTLSKMEGGFVNATAAGTLVIPAIDNGGRTRGEEELVRNSLDSPNWQVYLNVDQGKLMNRIAGVGMNASANDDYDIYDGLSMPHFFDSYLEVNHKKALNGNFFSKDIITTAQNHIWEFSINTSSLEEVMTFSWDNSYFGDNDRELYLWDVNMQRSINMRTAQEYVFNKNISNSFQVLYGSEDFVKEKSSVRELVLHKVWPNPADQEISIAFSLPETGEDQIVNIGMVDLMGRKVWSHERMYLSGFHEVKWQRSKEDATGIYLITLKTGSAYKQAKVVLK